MSHFGDQVGDHDPPISKKDHDPPYAPALPTDPEIAERAYHLWIERGCQEGSEQQNWLDAERELHDAALWRRLMRLAHEKGAGQS